MKIFTKKSIATVMLISAFSFQANAEITTQDYQTTGDSLLAFDSISKLEWLNVHMFKGMNFPTLQGVNQWTQDGFQLATDFQVIQFFLNAGIAHIEVGVFADTASTAAAIALRQQLGYVGSESLMGIIADNNNNGNSFQAVLDQYGNAFVNKNNDIWGSMITSHPSVGAFFVRATNPNIGYYGGPYDAPDDIMGSQSADVSATVPIALSLLGLGLTGLSRRRRS